MLRCSWCHGNTQHNTHIYLHPPHPWTLETHTHTHSLWSTRALVQMAPPCVDSVGSCWVTEDICYADDGGGGAPSACECVRVWTALRSKGDSLPERGFGNSARWRCHLSLNLVSPGVHEQSVNPLAFHSYAGSLPHALGWHGYHLLLFFILPHPLSPRYTVALCL